MDGKVRDLIVHHLTPMDLIYPSKLPLTPSVPSKASPPPYLALRHTLHKTLPLRPPPNLQRRLRRLIPGRSDHPIEPRHININIPRPSAPPPPFAEREIRHSERERPGSADLRLKHHASQPRHLGCGLRGRFEERVEFVRVGFAAEVAVWLFAGGEGGFLSVVGVWGVGVGISLDDGGGGGGVVVVVGFGAIGARSIIGSAGGGVVLIRFLVVIYIVVVAHKVPAAIGRGHAEDEFDRDEIRPRWSLGWGVWWPEKRG